MITDQDIQDLIRIPKEISIRAPASGYREEFGSRRCNLYLRFLSRTRREFPVFIRQHLRFTRNFSIGLRYTANQGKLTTITLVRYNGPHGETSKAPDGHYALPHIHYITADEIAKGHTHPQENHREVTDRYETLEEALRVFFRDTATQNYEGFFPDLLQGRLFSGY